jgi:two-component system, OmpR family, sensor kinase
MSIKRQLIILIISTVMLATFFAALHGYQNSIKQLNTMFDEELSTMANFIIAFAQTNNRFPEDIQSDFAYQVFSNDRLISHGKTTYNNQMLSTETGFSENTFYGQRWRTFSLIKNDLTVVVAHPTEKRIQSAESILFITITPILISIPIIGLIIFYFVGKNLKPLILLSNELKQKNFDDLSQITLEHAPVELDPVITRLNHLFDRLDSSFEQEKQLTANTAHELRTPVSVLTITAHNILKDFEKKTLTAETVFELQSNVERMAHVIEQVIALYRFTPENFNTKKDAINIETVLQEVISNNYDDLISHQQTISLESDRILVLGEHFALYTLFENVLRNAIKYSGEGSDIQISNAITSTALTVTIEDSGPGIDEAEFPKIFGRFYRSKTPQPRVKGSGLGLSIVKHIADLHSAKIECSRSLLGGLCVTVEFPHSILLIDSKAQE